MDESSVEVGKSEKALEFLDCSGLRPVLDGIHLPLVHLDAMLVYDVP